ncbi:MAG: UDP-N-acetylglucosamine diphosphorylase/glucosamine-1-phosphate N-acetyltransferase [Ferrovum sp. 21-44-67]|uniref:bifunctional UDP-N-acetylglucosamine diphosphorylase/glucosamine-1-phosphate N-acetyltransferase GlmU n=1 Tax=Ferrovum sp. JA12 TaxID=1356299 RepID=UPI0007031DC7|nr:bifunctional UDP-N-acetylglucosamine diphosphorylase/glucosamine-1-phosphate N-acetyltransferase GlmU [Ferrovum sp. JA12]KRH79378.1 bifunctional protein GlmU [Ferrovum sp. JA12]OYV79374.1 MAG: UDP-N-acetylglucosamine diphosphorylase/glucosamine-1-phosphate N-acetyltransferase [Ferrovum sp. 21-44-67]HQU06774.1 bifunctional UDP-N-acetylglucosamine diphosphorylase/glucosamine-1-phosphate N-acetyltransferase GlmU [Ferrovaceae bacterium]
MQSIPPQHLTSSLSVVLLAAGQGTRMRSSLPKVLHTLAGKPLINHVLERAQELDARQRLVVVGHQASRLLEHLKNEQVDTVIQQPQLGTGHALQLCLQNIPNSCDTVLVVYGDVPLLQTNTLQQLIYLCDGQHLALLTEIIEEPHGYGRILRDSSGQVVGIREQKDASQEEQTIREINTGIMALPRSKLDQWLSALTTHNAQGEYYLTDIVQLAHQQGITIHTCQPLYSWEAMGVNSQQQLSYLERAYQRHCAETWQSQGVAISDPNRFDVRGTLHCAQDVSIDVGCIFEGEVVLQEGVKVGPYSLLKNCTVESHTEILAFCHIEGAHIGAHNRIGPYARIRPMSVTQDQVHIGNFVEIKKTTLGQQSKVNHLTYLGDTIVGERVNVGAGTITCNYDGVNKHQTVIEDDVFIGSDTQLVAPVTIATGSTIGAGSTIVSSTPPNQLTLSRSKQQSIARWQRPKPRKS